MVKHNHFDKRYIKTRYSILKTFAKLIVTNPLRTIRIKDIYRKAGISGSTFYRHYKNLGTLIAQENIDILKKCIKSAIAVIDQYNIPAMSLKHNGAAGKNAEQKKKQLDGQAKYIYASDSLEIVSKSLKEIKQHDNAELRFDKSYENSFRKDVLLLIARFIHSLKFHSDLLRAEVYSGNILILVKLTDCLTPLLVWYLVKIKRKRGISPSDILLIKFRIAAEVQALYYMEEFKVGENSDDIKNANKILKIINKHIT